MSDLQNQTPADTYKGLLQVGDYTNGVDGNSEYVQDGEGTNSALSISTTKVGVGTVSPSAELDVNGGIEATTLTTSGAVTGGSVSTSGAVTAGSLDVSGNVVADEYALDATGASSSAVSIHAPATNELAIRTDSTERVRIDNSGKVGIATDPSTANLEVKGAEAFRCVGTDGNDKLRVFTASNGSVLGLGSNVGSSDTIRLDGRTGTPNDSYFNGGNVGIGETSPTNKLFVHDSATTFVQKIRSGSSTNAYGLEIQFMGNQDDTTSKYINCTTDGGTDNNFIVYSNGTIFADGTSLGSDDRIKHNEEKIVNAIETLSKITPKKYFKTSKLYDADHNFDLDSDGNPIDENGEPVNHRVEAGVIAQEVLGVEELKFAVSAETKDEDGNVITPHALNYNSLFTYAIAAIQEQQQIIEDLKARITALELG